MEIKDLSKEQLHELLIDFAKRWLAHDGLWFQAVEGAHGMEEAIRLDAAAWERFTVLEARRIMNFLGLREGGGLAALKKALSCRLYRFVNEQEFLEPEKGILIFRMNNCRVQAARKRKNLPDFPCKPVGLVETAALPDHRSRIGPAAACPPDPIPSTTAPGSSGSNRVGSSRVIGVKV